MVRGDASSEQFGDRYMGVPTTAPVLVTVVSSKNRAIPKSMR